MKHSDVTPTTVCRRFRWRGLGGDLYAVLGPLLGDGEGGAHGVHELGGVEGVTGVAGHPGAHVAMSRSPVERPAQPLDRPHRTVLWRVLEHKAVGDRKSTSLNYIPQVASRMPYSY